MRYYLDTEFIEGPQREIFPISLFRKKTPNTINLISIGIVAEDGREYYAISKDFNLREAWNRFQLEQQSGDMRNIFPEGRKVYWLRENVLNPIFMEFLNLERDYLEKQKRIIGYAPCIDSEFCYSNFKRLLNKFGKTNKEIASEIKTFVYTTSQINDPDCIENWEKVKHLFPIEFYAYYADYDWVVFCWLFGKMIDLPSGFPMYCNDLKQLMDEKEKSLTNAKGKIELVSEIIPKHECAMSAQFDSIKEFGSYPKQENEHSAIDDARWNKKLFEFLTQL